MKPGLLMRRPDWQLSRNGLFWVLFAFTAVVLLHLDHLPPWVTALAGLCILWRILEYRGVVPFPPWPLKVILVAGLHGRVDPGVSVAARPGADARDADSGVRVEVARNAL